MTLFQYLQTPLVAFFFAAFFLLVAMNNAHATIETDPINGTVTERGCEALDGAVKIQPLDSNQSQFVQVCDVDGILYELLAHDNPIMGPQGCIQVVARGTNPATGETIPFGNPCDVPRGCDPTNDWGGNYPFYYIHQQTLHFDESDYEIFVGANDFWCTQKSLDLESKKFEFDAIGRKTGEETLRLDIAVPDKVLGGNLTLLVDGNSTSFETLKKDRYTIVSATLDAYDQYERAHVELIGTEVIPEFGSTLILVMVISIVAFIAGTRVFGKFLIS